MRSVIECKTPFFRAVSGWVVPFLALGFVLGGLFFSKSASAQDDKKETEIKVFKRDKKPEREKMEQTGPQFKAEASQRQWKTTLSILANVGTILSLQISKHSYPGIP